MNLKEVKKYVSDAIEGYFKPKVLKKFDEDTNGNLTYDGDPISANTKVSGKSDNAIEVISDTTTPTNDGLYVEDLSSEIDKLNIAQKTVNEDMDYIQLSTSNQQVSLSPGDVIKFQNARVVHNMEFDTTTGYIKLEAHKSYCLRARLGIYSYSYIAYQFKDMTNNVKIGTAGLNMYKNNRDASDDTGSFAVAYITPSTDIDVALVVHDGTGTFDIQYTSSLEAYEIGRVVTVDPINYIDTKQGIQDTPVGHIVEIMDNKETKHYIQCDGSEKTIGTYPHLEQHFKEIGAINMFGGDGITTYKLPNIEPKPFAYVSYIPEMTSNNAPAPYVASADSIHSNPYQPYMAFNSEEGDAGHCWHSLSASSHWLQIDYGTPKKINSFKMKGRKSYSQWYGQMPTSFKLQGSNDGTNFVDIKSFSGLSWGSSIEVEFILDNPVEYRYYKLADMKSSSNFICFNKIEYAYDVKKYTFIKYEPTYFVGSINGKEDVVELLDGTLEGDFTHGSRHSFDLTKTKSLKQSIQDFDYIDVETRIYYEHDATSKGFYGNQITRVPVKDIILYQSSNLPWINTWQVTSMDMHLFGMLFGFKDNNTIYIYRVSSAPNTNSDNESDYKFYQICSVKGIRTNYSVSNKTV